MNWTYNGKEFTEEHIGDYFGIVYLITNIKNGRKYVGKKFFTQAGRRQIKGKVKKIRKPSNWLKYWGSNKVLQEDVNKQGEQNFTREILHLCKNKGELSYWETYEIFNRHALRTDEYYNDWVSCKVRKNHLEKKPDSVKFTPKIRKTQNTRPYH